MSEQDFVEQKYYKKSKFNIYEIIVRIVMLCGCKTCRIIERSKRVLEAAEMDAIRWSMRISQRED